MEITVLVCLPTSATVRSVNITPEMPFTLYVLLQRREGCKSVLHNIIVDKIIIPKTFLYINLATIMSKRFSPNVSKFNVRPLGLWKNISEWRVCKHYTDPARHFAERCIATNTSCAKLSNVRRRCESNLLNWVRMNRHHKCLSLIF